MDFGVQNENTNKHKKRSNELYDFRTVFKALEIDCNSEMKNKVSASAVKNLYARTTKGLAAANSKAVADNDCLYLRYKLMYLCVWCRFGHSKTIYDIKRYNNTPRQQEDMTAIIKE